MAEIYVSYATSDREWAMWVANALRSFGHQVVLQGELYDFERHLIEVLEQTEGSEARVLCVISTFYIKVLQDTGLESALDQRAIDRPGSVLFAAIEPVATGHMVSRYVTCRLFDIPKPEARRALRDMLDDLDLLEAPGVAQAASGALAAPRPAHGPASLSISEMLRLRHPSGDPDGWSASPPDGSVDEPGSGVFLPEDWDASTARPPEPAPRMALTAAPASPRAPVAALAPRPAASPHATNRLLPWISVAAAAAAAAWLLRHQIGAALSSIGSLFGSNAAPATFAALGIAPPAAESVPPQQPVIDQVDVSAFAPQSARPGDEVLVQVFLHHLRDGEAARGRAREADPSTTRRGTATLDAEIARNQRVDIVLEARHLDVDEPVQSVVWRGDPCACQFLVVVPRDAKLTSYQLRARVLLDKVPVGSLRFTLTVAEAAAETDRRLTMQGDAAQRHRHAFLSYASPDRPEVLKRAQALRAAGITFFQDVLSLEPGERWEQRLYEEIDRCDLFLLFWSKASAGSEWVQRETERAIARQDGSDGERPHIVPLILEGPPVPAPIPPALRHLHFNDHLLYFLAAAAMERQPPPPPGLDIPAFLLRGTNT